MKLLHDMIKPPSTFIVSPVIYAAWSDAMNATSAATSSTNPARFIEISRTQSAIK